MLFKPGVYNVLVPYGVLGVCKNYTKPPEWVRFTTHYWLGIGGVGRTPPDQPLGLPVSQLWYTPFPDQPPFVSVFPAFSVVTVDKEVEPEHGGVVCLPTDPRVWVCGWESKPMEGLSPGKKSNHLLSGAPFLFFQCSLVDPCVV